MFVEQLFCDRWSSYCCSFTFLVHVATLENRHCTLVFRGKDLEVQVPVPEGTPFPRSPFTAPRDAEKEPVKELTGSYLIPPDPL